MAAYGRVKFFNYIPVTPGEGRILARLGCRKTTVLDSNYQSLIEETIKQGALLCRPSGAYVRLPVIERSPDSIRLENGVEFRSKSLSDLLKDSCEVVLMASTVGKGVVDVIFNEIDHGDAARGVILDSVASQTADAVLDWMMNLLGGLLAKEGRKFTKHRYSPGFGDLPLSYQKPVFETLLLEKLGMELTEKFMLVPEKSVIAIAGVEEKGEGDRI